MKKYSLGDASGQGADWLDPWVMQVGKGLIGWSE
jgi:hypothetical protein